MRFFGIFFIFCLSIGTVSSLSIPSFITSLFSSLADQIQNQVCAYLIANPSRAATTTNTIINGLQKTNQTSTTFVQTISFLSSPQNQQNLVYNTTTCKTYFTGLKSAIQTDIANKNIDPSKVQDTVTQIWNDILNDLKKNLN